MATSPSMFLIRKLESGSLTPTLCAFSVYSLGKNSPFLGITKTDEPFVEWITKELERLKAEFSCDYVDAGSLSGSSILNDWSDEELKRGVKAFLASHYKIVRPSIDNLYDWKNRELFKCEECEDDGICKFTIVVLKISLAVDVSEKPKISYEYKSFKGHYEVKSS